MEVQILQLVEGAKKATGVTVIIDVFRAFSLECYIMSKGAEKIIPLGNIDEAYEYKRNNPEVLLAGERHGKKCEGFDFGNSPSEIENLDLTGKTIVHTTSAGTQGVANAHNADIILTASLVNARAVATYIKSLNPQIVSLVCMGLEAKAETEEDTLCAEYIKSILLNEDFDIAPKIQNLRYTSGAKFFDEAQREVFPEADFHLCTRVDIFDFVLKIEKMPNGLNYVKKLNGKVKKMITNLNSSIKLDGKLIYANEFKADGVTLISTQEEKDYIYKKTEIVNNSSKNSLQITETNVLDHTFDCKSTAFLHTLRGDDCSQSSFLPIDREIAVGEEIVFIPTGGRPSNATAFPYFDITLDGKSYLFAVGWSGQWKAIISRCENGVNVKIGLDQIDYYMEPGENFLLPSFCLVEGEPQEDAAALRRRFRRLLTTAFNPLPDGMTNLPISIQPYDRYFYGRCPDWPTVAGQIRTLEGAKKCEYIDTLWLDAAWFREGFPNGVGNYSFAEGFEGGLKPVADAVHEAGMRFMVWFEPERIYRGSEVFVNHRDYVLAKPDDTNHHLYNLSDDEACEWLQNTLINFIRDNGIDNYRQDFNTEPLPYWLANDKEGRKGVIEMRYVRNLYKLWDAMRAEFPDLFIDNCASGGRRLDFELMRRSVPMWRSDITCGPVKEDWHSDVWNQNQTLTLSEYLPYHGCAVWELVPNEVRSAATAGLACTFDVLKEGYDFDRAKTLVGEVKRLSEYWHGDFYPLTAPTLEEDVFAAYQLAKENAGYAVIYRRANCENDKFNLKLNVIDENANYTVTITDEELVKTVNIFSGTELISGVDVVIPKKYTSAIFEYAKI